MSSRRPARPPRPHPGHQCSAAELALLAALVERPLRTGGVLGEEIRFPNGHCVIFQRDSPPGSVLVYDNNGRPAGHTVVVSVADAERLLREVGARAPVLPQVTLALR